MENWFLEVQRTYHKIHVAISAMYYSLTSTGEMQDFIFSDCGNFQSKLGLHMDQVISCPFVIH